MRRYLLTDEAKQDLADIKRYLVREAGPRVARSTLLKIKEAFIFLGSTPGAGHVREDLTSDPLVDIRKPAILGYTIHTKRNTECLLFSNVGLSSRPV